MKSFEEIIKELSPELQEEVMDFAKFLLERKSKPGQKKLRLTWAGGLKEFRDKFTSLDLQRKSLEWWGD